MEPIHYENRITVLSLFNREFVHAATPAGAAVVDGDVHVAAVAVFDAVNIIRDPLRARIVVGDFGAPRPGVVQYPRERGLVVS